MDLILLLIVAFIFYALVSLRVLKQYERSWCFCLANLLASAGRG